MKIILFLLVILLFIASVLPVFQNYTIVAVPKMYSSSSQAPSVFTRDDRGMWTYNWKMPRTHRNHTYIPLVLSIGDKDYEKIILEVVYLFGRERSDLHNITLQVIEKRYSPEWVSGLWLHHSYDPEDEPK